MGSGPDGADPRWNQLDYYEQAYQAHRRAGQASRAGVQGAERLQEEGGSTTKLPSASLDDVEKSFKGQKKSYDDWKKLADLRDVEDAKKKAEIAYNAAVYARDSKESAEGVNYGPFEEIPGELKEQFQTKDIPLYTREAKSRQEIKDFAANDRMLLA